MNIDADFDSIIGRLITWGPFAAIIAVGMTQSVQAAAVNQSGSSAKVTAVASAVISKGVGVRDQQLSYTRIASDYVRPQRTKTDCDQSIKNSNCTMIIMEMK